jgi:hypothetical protein
VVEGVVILPRQPRGPVVVLPYPLAEPVFELLLPFTGRDGLPLVDDAGFVRALVIGGGNAAIERLLDEVGGVKARRAVGGRVADFGFGVAVERDVPGCNRPGVRNRDRALGNIEQLDDEVADVARRNPGGAEAGADVAGQQVFRLDGLERIDVAGVAWIERGGGGRGF